ncbi:MAG TPA: MoxR family ATPase [Planctomycetes bacterium]|nr:MoxR family ATPase [Planctomycetota bacterium]HIN80337.1 MoxR family ATPase [Planctomycetota bacterium]
MHAVPDDDSLAPGEDTPSEDPTPGGDDGLGETSDGLHFEEIQETSGKIREQLRKVIVGQEAVVDLLLISLFAGGHSLLVGVPGLAKTLLISTLADALSLSFNRIQFTPDLMPSDITGTEVIQEDARTGERIFRFLPGPIFSNVILADEINRTPPKTQAALLEAMQEKQVTVGGERHPLEQPFFVLATQNPIEQEGTYPLPEAQLDRFMFNIVVNYPSSEEELEIMQRTTSGLSSDVVAVVDSEQILKLQKLVRRVPIADDVIRYALNLIRATRVSTGGVPDFISKNIEWGAGPRAGQYLVLGGKANAILKGRPNVTYDDIAKVAHPVLRHRIVTNFAAEAEGITADHIISRLLEETSKNG